MRLIVPSYLSFPSTFLFVLFTVALAILIRTSTSLHGYSGRASPPMFGDFEAQRHFMETTVNLPVRDWYRYDLKYWGLDYPPLTAYHSYLCGIIARWINPSWMELKTSRGIETKEVVLFMRRSSLLSDLIVYVTAALACTTLWRRVFNIPLTDARYVTLLLALQPAVMVIDHGHFQYNAVMLGLTLWSLFYMAKERYVIGAVLFCLAIGFKHMALYYSLAFFSFLLGICIRRRLNGIGLLIQLGLAVITTFGLLLAPFYVFGSVDDVLQVFRRLFPFERGLYEDKVANFWCAISIVIKLRNLFSLDELVRLSGLTTLVACFPSCLCVFMRPTMKTFFYALLNVSLAFFLFSFQVHEKSILLPLLPATILFVEHPIWTDWFIQVSMYSLYPLLKKDECAIAWLALLMLWTSLSSFSSLQTRSIFGRLIVLGSYAVLLASVVGERVVEAPKRYPDLYVMMNVVVSTGVFMIFFVYMNVQQWRTKLKSQ